MCHAARVSTLEMSRWHLPADAACAPDAPGVVQIKTTSGLVDYPTGKSAMVRYGAGASVAAVVARGLADSTREGDSDALRWRYVTCADPDGVLSTLCDRFERRFGARLPTITLPVVGPVGRAE